ncbi:MAG: AtpZ/AtpI family protein [Prosthecobacter sp.]|uniref:AtpZ/AtpI family protein n=1 Tax=Prosthecobacter sp. TaxID=1965333 RepID=UPI00260E9F42|nr:AtpZ/AtpI family protein [Prosthecobacter sp.]MCF7789506.1 AtpZ/AtpI family protein [Prosthecobacter sp.]
MREQPPVPEAKSEATLAEEVGAKAMRKLKARRHSTSPVWFGLGMMGLVGWSVVVPTLLGAALGLWMDRNHPGAHSWTLALLVAGLVLGCVNAWRWIDKEDKAMGEEQKNKEEDDDE